MCDDKKFMILIMTILTAARMVVRVLVLVVVLVAATTVSARMAGELPGGFRISPGFSCQGREYGFYADVENRCRAYHVCQPVHDEFEKVRTVRVCVYVCRARVRTCLCVRVCRGRVRTCVCMCTGRVRSCMYAQSNKTLSCHGQLSLVPYYSRTRKHFNSRH